MAVTARLYNCSLQSKAVYKSACIQGCKLKMNRAVELLDNFERYRGRWFDASLNFPIDPILYCGPILSLTSVLELWWEIIHKDWIEDLIRYSTKYSKF